MAVSAFFIDCFAQLGLVVALLFNFAITVFQRLHQFELQTGKALTELNHREFDVRTYERALFLRYGGLGAGPQMVEIEASRFKHVAKRLHLFLQVESVLDCLHVLPTCIRHLQRLLVEFARFCSLCTAALPCGCRQSAGLIDGKSIFFVRLQRNLSLENVV